MSDVLAAFGSALAGAVVGGAISAWATISATKRSLAASSTALSATLHEERNAREDERMAARADEHRVALQRWLHVLADLEPEMWLIGDGLGSSNRSREVIQMLRRADDTVTPLLLPGPCRDRLRVFRSLADEVVGFGRVAQRDGETYQESLNRDTDVLRRRRADLSGWLEYCRRTMRADLYGDELPPAVDAPDVVDEDRTEPWTWTGAALGDDSFG